MGDSMSLIKTNNITNVSGGIPTVKGQQLIPTAWVVFNGTGSVAVIGSENVSSITDNATGRYTVNFATAFANTNYCATGVARYTNTSWSWASLGMASNDTKTTTAMKFGTTLVSNYFLDSPEVGLTFMGGQS